MGLTAFIISCISLILVFSLRNRIQELEEQIQRDAHTQKPETNDRPLHIESQQLVASKSGTDIPKESGQAAFDTFAKWLREDWMLKLGALLLLIGFGWLTTYAFLNNWIGPMGRITLGVIAGTLFIGLGWWRIKNYIHQGGVFLVLGSTVVLLTMFAARELYGFFTPATALAVMCLSVVFVAFASVRYRDWKLALASLILAGIVPLLTNAPVPDYVGLFAYLYVVTLGTVWVVAIIGKRELTTAALILVVLYSVPHLLWIVSADNEVLLLFAYAFTTLFFVTNTASILKRKEGNITADLVTAAGNGLFLLAWIVSAAQNEWKSTIIAAWTVVFAVGAFLIFKITQRREPFYTYAGVGITMLAAATAVELTGATLTIAYTLESGMIVLGAYLIVRDTGIVEKMSILLAGPAVLSVTSLMSPKWAIGIIHKDFFVLCVLAFVFLGLGTFFLRHMLDVQKGRLRQVCATLLVIGSLYVYALLWLSLHAGLHNDNIAVMISLVMYTVIGLAAYFYGFANKKIGLRLYGGVLVGFVVVRLLLVDVWNMELAGRIITFFLIGTLLVSTAFLGKKKKDKNITSIM